MDKHVYAERRARFFEVIGQGVAVIPSAPVHLRNGDVEHDYRQDSDFFYLTGFDEPESVLVLVGAGAAGQEAAPKAVLFVREKDPERELWDGARAGTEGAVERFGAQEAFPIGELGKRLPDLLTDVRTVFYRLGHYRDFDGVLMEAVAEVRKRARRGVCAPAVFVDSADFLHEARLFKSTDELEAIVAAGAITRKAHVKAMEVARPGRFEYEVEAELLHVFRQGGAERAAYGSIVGSGPNATVLHYRSNNRCMQDGDLLLIDAGAELNYYASDVTRTFPVAGKFTPPQRRLYDLVLQAQVASIEAVRPGATLQDIHDASVQVLTEGLIALGIIAGPLDKALEEKRYLPYYMHKTSHFLGMDVHDVGNYYLDGKPRPLQPGMVLTVEPGLYVAEKSEAPEEYRGIGIRIEDDIAVTDHGYRNLTPDIPKEATEIESLLANR